MSFRRDPLDTQALLTRNKYRVTTFGSTEKLGKSSLINSHWMANEETSIFHLLRHANNFIFIVESLNGSTLGFKGVQIDFPPPKNTIDSLAPEIIKVNKIECSEKELPTIINAYTRVQSQNITAEHKKLIEAYFDKPQYEHGWGRGYYQYDRNSDDNYEMLTSLREFFHPLFKELPHLKIMNALERALPVVSREEALMGDRDKGCCRIL